MVGLSINSHGRNPLLDGFACEELSWKHVLENEVQFIDFKVSQKRLLEDAARVVLTIFPAWNQEKLVIKQLCDGITNKLVLLRHEGDSVLVRTYGHNSDILIDREQELLNMLKLSKHGLASNLVARFNNGIVYGYIDGSVCTVDEMSDPVKSQLISQQLSKWHSLDCDPNPRLFSTLSRWISAVPLAYSDEEKQLKFQKSGFSVGLLGQELEWLQATLQNFSSPVVFCHNDLLSGNIVFVKGEDRALFIDYEYGFPSYRGFDIANHFCEYAGFDCDWSKYPSKEYQLQWLASYLQNVNSSESTESLFQEVEHFSLAAHFFWGVWALVQAEISDIDFDYLSYGIMRLNQYFIRKGSLLQQIV